MLWILWIIGDRGVCEAGQNLVHAEVEPAVDRLIAITRANQAYGLTPDEIELLWRTAPPRMPVSHIG